MSGLVFPEKVLVANGATTSSAVRLNGNRLVGIALPSAITSTTATFELAFPSDIGGGDVAGTWKRAVSTAGVAMSITFVANDYVVIDPSALSGATWVRLVMGSAEGAAREITVALSKRM